LSVLPLGSFERTASTEPCVDVASPSSHIPHGFYTCEAKVASEPEVLIARFAQHGVAIEYIGLEVGHVPLWLYGASCQGAGSANLDPGW